MNRLPLKRVLAEPAQTLRLLLPAIVLAVAFISGESVHAASTELVSVDSIAAQSDGVSVIPSVSADGRFVTFSSPATNLVAGDTNGVYDVFVRDRIGETTERVSVDSAGSQVNEDSYAPSEISANGRFVAFGSLAATLVSGDSNGAQDVFVKDRQTGVTELVSLDSSEVQGNSNSEHPSISADGRYVAFQSYASNLVPGDTNGYLDVFVRDRQTGTTERVSVSTGNGQANRPVSDAHITPDGRHVSFSSEASNLVTGDTNGHYDVFVRDRQSATTERVSVDTAGMEANGSSGGPSISGDGRYVAFESLAALVGEDTNGAADLFVRDREAETTERVSVDSAEMQVTGENYESWLSADGRYVAFRTNASDLVQGDTNGSYDVFLRDRVAGTTERVSVDSGGSQANGDSLAPSMSANGIVVAFHSSATNLVGSDTNGFTDVFVRIFDDDDDAVHEHEDNCPLDPNPAQQNSVHPLTALGDHCEDPEPDTFFDFFDNCPNTPNTGQDNADADAWGDACDECPATATQWLVPQQDLDCDGFTGADETSITTDPGEACGFTPGGALASETWPPDLLESNSVNISDVLAMKPVFGMTSSPTTVRYDIVPGNGINIQDVLAVKPFFGKSCTT